MTRNWCNEDQSLVLDIKLEINQKLQIGIKQRQHTVDRIIITPNRKLIVGVNATK